MKLFRSGIRITEIEHQCLIYTVTDAESWLTGIIADKVSARRDALIAEYRPKLFADQTIAELPADDHDLAAFIIGREDFKTRSERDAAQKPPIFPQKHNIAKFEGRSRVGLETRRPERVPREASIKLFPGGIDISDTDAGCVLYYVQNLEDWVIGALLGQINRGRKKLITEYHPVVMGNPDIKTIPATEIGLLTAIFKLKAA